ncbi:hypothetical protein BJX64DRAFT_259462 [Aspergillus heterothallicus]
MVPKPSGIQICRRVTSLGADRVSQANRPTRPRISPNSTPLFPLLPAAQHCAWPGISWFSSSDDGATGAGRVILLFGGKCCCCLLILLLVAGEMSIPFPLP